MEFEAALRFVELRMAEQLDRTLTEAERGILFGAWNDQTYEQVAEAYGYSLNYLQRSVAPKLWKLLSQVFDRQFNKTNARAVLLQLLQQAEQDPVQDLTVQDLTVQDLTVQHLAPAPTSTMTSPSYGEVNTSTSTVDLVPLAQINWGEAIDVSSFYGRKQELETLTQWILLDRCKLIALLGMGGIGKSSLAAKIAQAFQHQFEFVIWRSLRNAPPLETLLADLVPFLSRQQDTQATLDRLLYWLRQSRCLVILDNVETILQAGDRAGYYQPNYENYGNLLRSLGETIHQSCVILTSREKPAEVGMIEGYDTSIRSLPLMGSLEAALAILDQKGLAGSEQEKQQLCNHYNCSPLALKIVATSIQNLFDGDISAFLTQDVLVFNGLRRLLEQQWERLSTLEQTIMYWLAVNREPTSITELLQDMIPGIPRARLMTALQSLIDRSLIEKSTGSYTQQPVVMEYVTTQFIENMISELVTPKLSTFNQYALIKTTVKDYVRESQKRVILGEIAENLCSRFSTLEALGKHFRDLLKLLHRHSEWSQGYSVGNLINLCCYLKIDLTGYDFSTLTIRHANLQKVRLHQVNFANAHFFHSLFTQPFGAILSVAFSPDGTQVATGDAAGNVYVWRVSDSQPLLQLRGHTGWVRSVRFCPRKLGGRSHYLLASSSNDKTVRLWDTQTGECLQTLLGHTNWVFSVAWSPDGTRLASASFDTTIKLWDVATGQCLQTLQGHQAMAFSVAWNPNGTPLASSSADQTIKIWDVETGQCLQTLQGHNHIVSTVNWSPDGMTLASGSFDHTLKLWNTQGTCSQTLRGHRANVWSIAWSPEGQQLASCAEDAVVRLWDFRTGQCSQVLQGHTNDWVWSVAWSPDGQLLASGGDDWTVRLWDAQTGQCLKILQGYTAQIWSIDWHPEGQILASGAQDERVRFWDVQTGQCFKTLEGHTSLIWSIAWSPDGKILASGAQDKQIRLWDSQTGQCLKILQGHENWVFAVTWSPNGQVLASGSSDQTVRLWDRETGQCLQTLHHPSFIWSVAWNLDGTLLACGTQDGTIKLWEVATGTCLQSWREHRELVWSLSWSPDDQWIASGSGDQTIKIWDRHRGQCLRTLQGHRDLVWSVVWHPNGQWLASGSQDNTIRIWEIATGQCFRLLEGHTSWVQSVVWSPKGELLASGSSDETIRLWDVQAGLCLKIMRSDRPYEGTNIAGATGITEAQKATMIALGAES